MEQLIEVRNICRFCSSLGSDEILRPLFKDEDEIFPINTENNPRIKVSKMAEMLMGIKMNISDELPKFICVLCYDKLVSSFVFRQQCLLSIKNLEDKLINDNKRKQDQIADVCQNLNGTQITIKQEPGVNEIINVYEQNIVDKTESNILLNEGKKSTILKQKHNPLDNSIKKLVKTNNKSTVCAICGESSKKISAHMERMHSTNGPFQCHFCNKIFKAKSYLKIHFKIHLNVRKYKCKLCDKAFVDNTSLRVHMLNHTDERKYKCKICDKSFRQSCVLGTHMKSHTQEQNFICDICGQRFLTYRYKKAHEILHTNESPFKCEFCAKGFKSSGSLSMHRFNAHTKLNPYRCEICNKTFIKRVEFNTHKRQHEYKII